MPEKHFHESRENLQMYVSMKLGYKPLIYDGFGPGDNFKKQIESVV